MSAAAKLLAVAIAIVMATVWPRKLEALPFIIIGLALILLPGNRWIQFVLSRGMPLSESPPFALSVLAWFFILGMPLVLAWLIP